jgi:hypothetical protein
LCNINGRPLTVSHLSNLTHPRLPSLPSLRLLPRSPYINTSTANHPPTSHILLLPPPRTNSARDHLTLPPLQQPHTCSVSIARLSSSRSPLLSWLIDVARSIIDRAAFAMPPSARFPLCVTTTVCTVTPLSVNAAHSSAPRPGSRATSAMETVTCARERLPRSCRSTHHVWGSRIAFTVASAATPTTAALKSLTNIS